MITRSTLKRGRNLSIRTDPAPDASVHLEREGWAHVPGAFTADEVAELQDDMRRVFATVPAEARMPDATVEDYEDFRYESLNHSAVAQRAVAHRSVLDVIEPLLGEDCHVISNTCWWNRPQREKAPFDVGNPWHVDGGPHIPRPEGIEWDERIPYPVFMVGCHILLQDCPADAGPTGFSPRSHTSGRLPPMPDADGNVSYDGRPPAVPLGVAGDVVLFVSDVWHRRMPTGPSDPGRFFLQVQYGRRDIAQRIRPTSAVHHLSDAAVARATTERERTVVGLHPPGFFDG